MDRLIERSPDGAKRNPGTGLKTMSGPAIPKRPWGAPDTMQIFQNIKQASHVEPAAAKNHHNPFRK
jgi:hypothetical protein